MTGKEALIQVSKSCSDLALEFGGVKIYKEDNEALQTLKEIVIKYGKYKRAFEILKNKFYLREPYDVVGLPSYTAYELGGCSADYIIEISKEEYELLEELLND